MSLTLPRPEVLMALHLLATNDVVHVRYSGSDLQINDAENVLFYVYSAGLAPSPGGTTVKDWAPVAGAFWSGFWSPFQSVDFTWLETAMSAIQSLTPVAPDRFKLVAFDRWASFQFVAGTVARPTAPAYVAFNVRKIVGAAGRGRQGHIRVPGLASASVSDNLVNTITLGVINAALAGANPLSVPFGGGFTDLLTPIVMNGRLVNTNPGNPPIFYSEFVNQFVCSDRIGSQITRKLGRHRS